MRKLFFVIASAQCLLSGCAQPCNNVSFASWNLVDRVVVEVVGQHQQQTIVDPVAIQKIRVFLSRRADHWEQPFPDTPMGAVRLDAYQGDKGISYMAVGPTFLEAPGCGYVVSRKLSGDDQREILGILGISNTVFQLH